MENTRVGFIGIIIENRAENAEKVNAIISQFGNQILSRMGIPYERKNCAVITLIVDMSTDTVGNITGKIGSIEGVSVKSALSSK